MSNLPDTLAQINSFVKLNSTTTQLIPITQIQHPVMNNSSESFLGIPIWVYQYIFLPGLSFLFGLIINEILKTKRKYKDIIKTKEYISIWIYDFIYYLNKALEEINNFKTGLKIIDGDTHTLGTFSFHSDLILEIDKNKLYDLFINYSEIKSKDNEIMLIKLLKGMNYLKTFNSNLKEIYDEFSDERKIYIEEYMKLKKGFQIKLNDIKNYNKKNEVGGNFDNDIDKIFENFKIEETKIRKINPNGAGVIDKEIELLIDPIRKICENVQGTHNERYLPVFYDGNGIIEVINRIKACHNNTISQTKHVYENLQLAKSDLIKLELHLSKKKIVHWLKFWK